MILNSLSELSYHNELAVIINVGTRFSATLALLSAQRFMDIPVLIIDSFKNNESKIIYSDYEYLLSLEKVCNFYLLKMPLKNHGETLDYIFKNINSSKVFLIDSDIEILNDEAITYMRKYINNNDIFGSGFIQGPHNRIVFRFNGYYHERMWIPFTLLDVDKIRTALDIGLSFESYSIYNDFPKVQFISRLLYKSHDFNLFKKYHIQHNSTFKLLNIFKTGFNGYKPSLIFYDTGAEIYQYLRYKKDYYFVGFTEKISHLFINHYHGVTRRIINDKDSNSIKYDKIESEIKKRLINIYDFNIEDYII